MSRQAGAVMSVAVATILAVTASGALTRVPAPMSEPATMLLAGAGLFVIGRRLRARRDP